MQARQERRGISHRGEYRHLPSRLLHKRQPLGAFGRLGDHLFETDSLVWGAFLRGQRGDGRGQSFVERL